MGAGWGVQVAHALTKPMLLLSAQNYASTTKFKKQQSHIILFEESRFCLLPLLGPGCSSGCFKTKLIVKFALQQKPLDFSTPASATYIPHLFSTFLYRNRSLFRAKPQIEERHPFLEAHSNDAILELLTFVARRAKQIGCPLFFGAKLPQTSAACPNVGVMSSTQMPWALLGHDLGYCASTNPNRINCREA